MPISAPIHHFGQLAKTQAVTIATRCLYCSDTGSRLMPRKSTPARFHGAAPTTIRPC